MNRTAKRQLEREQSRNVREPLITIRRSAMMEIINKEIEKASIEVQHSAIRTAIKALTSAFVLTLHDKDGWGKKRIERLLDNVNELLLYIQIGEVTIDDIKQVCEDEIRLDRKYLNGMEG